MFTIISPVSGYSRPLIISCNIIRNNDSVQFTSIKCEFTNGCRICGQRISSSRVLCCRIKDQLSGWKPLIGIFCRIPFPVQNTIYGIISLRIFYYIDLFQIICFTKCSYTQRIPLICQVQIYCLYLRVHKSTWEQTSSCFDFNHRQLRTIFQFICPDCLQISFRIQRCKFWTIFQSQGFKCTFCINFSKIRATRYLQTTKVACRIHCFKLAATTKPQNIRISIKYYCFNTRKCTIRND